jgi:hypothetical protein
MLREEIGSMRTLLAGCVLLLLGCTKQNPAYDDGGDASDAAGPTGDPGTTGAPPPTTGPVTTVTTDATDGGSTAAVSGATTTGGDDPTLDPTTGGASTGADTGTSTGGSSTKECLKYEYLSTGLVAEDAGVVPDFGVAPCAPWETGDPANCHRLNFGRTAFFRLVKDPGLAPRQPAHERQSVALLRFPTTLEDLEAQAMDVGDLTGARIGIVVWEPKDAPSPGVELAVHLLSPENADWGEGDKAQQLADDGDSSHECKTRAGDSCVPWTEGHPLVGKLATVPLLLMNGVDDPQDDGPNQYHTRFYSGTIALDDLAAAFVGDKLPSFAVTVETDRVWNDESVKIGVKLKESEPWTDPELQLEVCTQWSS